MSRLNLLLLFFLLMAMTGCTYVSQGVFIEADRKAVAQPNDHFGDSANEIAYLNQNWDRWDSLWFYSTTQGSDFMPYQLFLNLEQADNENLFRAPEHISQFRYLVQRESKNNPDALPVGIVKDTYQGKDYVGFTCAACHTTQINYQGTGLRIDGAPALSDMDGMLRALETALSATLNDADKLSRLASNMGLDIAGTKDEVRASHHWLKKYNQINLPTNEGKTIHYGYGRLDAFGRIYNRVLQHMTPGDLSNSNPPNAPVSYPFLWDTPQHDFVQWNGIGNNNEGPPIGFLGPLGRNAGEVLGVFANFSLEKQEPLLGYKASIDKHNLGRLERHLVDLHSPVWPEEILPPIDQALAEKGKKVYYAYKCQKCHGTDQSFKRDDSSRLIEAQFASVPLIGTDPKMATNALAYQGKSGILKGRQIERNAPNFGEITPVVYALSHVVQKMIIARDPDKSWIRGRLEWLIDFISSAIDNPVRDKTNFHLDFKINNDTPNNLNAYKARPLNGIWATAPYLHNGSVPNLYELFLPSCSDSEISQGKQCRSNRFTVGSREFDPLKVGFVSKDKSRYPSLFEYDTSLPGNSNTGHEYAAGKTALIRLDNDNNPILKPDGSFELEWFPPVNEGHRMALVEYLKTL